MRTPSPCTLAADESIGTDLGARRLAAAGPAYDRGSLFTLALGTFAVGTEGFMIAAILPAPSRRTRDPLERAAATISDTFEPARR